jgi:hypothetical protein
LKSFTVPIIDFSLITAGLFFIKNIYQQQTGFNENIYSEKLLSVAFPLYAIVWIVMVYFNGGYDKPIKLVKIGRGVIIGTVFILMGYSLLPESLRFSRALILLGTSWALLSFLILRLVFHILKLKSYSLSSAKTKRIAIIGEEAECMRVNQLLKETHINPSFVGFVSIENYTGNNQSYIGKINQITEIINIHHINEIIFCAKDISSQFIINNMLTLVSSGVDFKIAPPESLSIIGSNSIDTAGDLYMIDVNSITKPKNKRNKRLLDIGISILLLILSPVLFFIQEQKTHFFVNIFNVLFGFYSWVGYGRVADKSLPEIKRSILSPVCLFTKEEDNSKTKLMNLRYAKDYSIEKDLIIMWKCLKKLGI